MSKKNIIRILPGETIGGIPTSVQVTFACRDGETKTYEYTTFEAVKGILSGDDPSLWSGSEVS